MKNDPTVLIFAPDQGGGAAVADAPAQKSTMDAPAPKPDSKDAAKLDPGIRDLIASTFKSEPLTESNTRRRVNAPKEEPKKIDPQATDQSSPAQAEAQKAPATPKSIFDAAAPKKTEQDPVSAPDDDNLPENDWKAAKLARKALRDQIAAKEADLKRYQEELAAYRQKAPDPSEIERIKAENKEALDRLAVLDYKSHPEYKKKFLEPQNALLAQAQTILTDNGVEGVDLQSLLSKPRSEFAKAMSELDGKLNSFDSGEIRATMRELQKIREAEKASMAQHGDLTEGLRRQSEMRARAAFEEAARDEASWFMKPAEIPPGTPPEEVSKWTSFNSGLKELRTKAEKYAFQATSDRDSAALAVKAAQLDFMKEHALPIMYRDYQSAKETIGQLEAKLKELGAVRPGACMEAGASGASAEKKDSDLSVQELIAKTYRR